MVILYYSHCLLFLLNSFCICNFVRPSGCVYTVNQRSKMQPNTVNSHLNSTSRNIHSTYTHTCFWSILPLIFLINTLLCFIWKGGGTIAIQQIFRIFICFIQFSNAQLILWTNNLSVKPSVRMSKLSVQEVVTHFI